MPEVTLAIGSRSFKVACQPGEEDNLHQAAALLNTEAEALQNAIGRVPETRMLLMAGLMLADRMIELGSKAAEAETRAEDLSQQLRNVEKKAAELATRALHADNAVSEKDLRAAQKEAASALDALARATERVERLAGI